MDTPISQRILLLAAFLPLIALQTAEGQTLSNPLFPSQDPYVTFWNGNYYYTQSGHNAIQVIKSPTLIGLTTNAAVTVWTSPWVGLDGHANVWAPEIHQVNGKWYIYFSADFQSNGKHRLYVLQGGSTPLDPYVIAETGAKNGQIVESTGKWAIDPDVFIGPDGKLYLTWSCTADDIGTPPQSLCIAQMSDALHTATATVRIATPTESWETRTGPIEEGPVGFLHNGTTYLTYSASASWTPNDYTVGVLTNPTGNLLDPNAWVKQGPIFDHHGKAYGPGSVVFVPSVDGTELWTLYHGYDRLDCAAWACRSIRAQKISWDANGLPLLGYPMDPGVKSWAPSGDMASPTGWGNAHSGTAASTGWTYNSASSVDSISGSGDGSLLQAFRGDLNPIAFAVSTELQLDSGSAGEYGVFALYKDSANHVEAYLDAASGQFVSTATVGGQDQGSRLYPLAAAFDLAVPHKIKIVRSAASVFSFYLDGILTDHRTFAVDFGQIGLLASTAGAHFRGIALTDNSAGWGDAFGDAAEGLSRDITSLQPGNGYAHGSWTIQNGGAVQSSSSGSGWNMLYQGSPNFINYTARVDAQLVKAGTAISAESRFGLIACHDDRNNQLSVWVDANQGTFSWNSVVQGQSNWQSMALPAGFDATEFHTLAVTKSGTFFSFFLDGNPMVQQTFNLLNGMSGVVTQDAQVNFRNFAILDQ